jgi:uncharacterized protein with LGFP repeats
MPPVTPADVATLKAIEQTAATQNLGAPLGSPRHEGGYWEMPYHTAWVVGYGTAAYVLDRAIYGKWRSVSARLGRPTANTHADGEARASAFAQGVIYSSEATGTHVIYADMLAAWKAAGGVNGWGIPASDPFIPVDKKGEQQLFQKGRSLSSTGM